MTPSQVNQVRETAISNGDEWLAMMADHVLKLHKLIRYLAEFAEEQGADFNLFYESDPTEFNYLLLTEIITDIPQ